MYTHCVLSSGFSNAPFSERVALIQGHQDPPICHIFHFLFTLSFQTTDTNIRDVILHTDSFYLLLRLPKNRQWSLYSTESKPSSN